MYGTLVNGTAAAHVGVADRGLQYGDGLFETIAVHDGRPVLWERHLQRLQAGCRRLAIAAPPAGLLEDEARRLCGGLQRAVLKIIVTRGAGGRGYGPPRHGAVTRIVSTHPPPDYPPSFYTDGVAVRVCRTRLACRHPLAGLKHLNRLEQVMARGEWDDPDVPEGLMLDHDDHLIEGTMSNVFLVDGDQLITPDVSGSGVAGIMRGLILELAPDLAMTPVVRPVFVTELGTAGEVFVCNSLIGLWPVKAVDGDRRLRPGPATRRLAETVAASSGLG